MNDAFIYFYSTLDIFQRGFFFKVIFFTFCSDKLILLFHFYFCFIYFSPRLFCLVLCFVLCFISFMCFVFIFFILLLKV